MSLSGTCICCGQIFLKKKKKVNLGLLEIMRWIFHLRLGLNKIRMQIVYCCFPVWVAHCAWSSAYRHSVLPCPIQLSQFILSYIFFW